MRILQGLIIHLFINLGGKIKINIYKTDLTITQDMIHNKNKFHILKEKLLEISRMHSIKFEKSAQAYVSLPYNGRK